METMLKNLKRDEAAALELRALFERRGFRRASVNKFEEYSLYIENKNFLQSDTVITFMDMDGKLMALKPDVTLSIVKNVPRQAPACFEKLYYLDEVYRLSRENREYKVLSQIGVELIGPVDGFSGAEVIDLALESLRTISGGRYVLDISHLGFVSGLLEQTGLSLRVQKRLLECIHQKSAHEIERVLDQTNISPDHRQRLLDLCGIHGSFERALPKAKTLAVGEAMEEAIRELEVLGEVLSRAGLAEQVSLDFSVVNDVDYYNGLIFLGYVEGVPGVVLTGGRYDNLLAKMGKKSGAIGFAVYLSELGVSHGPQEESKDFDLLITYGSDADHAALLGEIKRLTAQGKSVRLERDDCDLQSLSFTWAEHWRFVTDRLEQGGEGC